MSISTSTTGAGGLVPEEWAGSVIVDVLRDESIAFDPRVATQYSTELHDVHLPVLTSDGDSGWVAEAATISTDDATFAEVTVTPSKVGALRKYSRELADDSQNVAATALGQSLGRSIARQIDAAFLGNLDSPAPAGLESLTETNTIELTGLSNLDWAAEAVQNAAAVGAKPSAFIVGGDTLVTLANLKDQSGSNRALLEADATGGYRVAGIPVIVNTATAADTIWAVDYRRVYTVIRTDTRVDVSAAAMFDSDQLVARAIARVGFGFVDQNALTKITYSES